MEIEIYHTAKDSDKLLGVSVLFQEDASASNPFLQAYVDGVASLPVWTLESFAASASLAGKYAQGFDLENLLPKEDISPGHELTFFNYEGSMTQPPCTTGVDWWVLQHPLKASPAQIAHFRQAVLKSASTPHGNARELQSLSDRKVCSLRFMLPVSSSVCEGRGACFISPRAYSLYG